jgi:multiple sugar transport system substrate-binding protein
MKTLFTALFAILALLSLVAWKMIPPPVADGKTVIVWATDNNPVRQEQVDLFNKLNPDLHLVIDPANRATEKVIVQSIGGVGPDVFDSYGELTLRTYVKSGIAYDVTDALQNKGIDVFTMLWPVSLPSCTLDGRVYGVPCNVNAHAVWYNKDIFDAEGIPYPKPGWTWDELIKTAQKLTKRDERGKPSRFGFHFDFGAWGDLMHQYGARVYSEDGTKMTMDTPEATAALQRWKDIVYKHNVSPTPVQEAALATQGGWGSGAITYLLGGRVAMAFGGRWWLNLMRKEKNCPRLGVVELPYDRVPALQGGARCALVNARSPRRDIAVRFLEYLASQDYNELLNDQADAISGVKRYAYTPRFLHNPAYPDEDYNAVWRSALEKARPEMVSIFAKGSELGPFNTQLDLIKANLKEVEPALRDATTTMNDRIRRVARNQPALGELFFERTGERP